MTQGAARSVQTSSRALPSRDRRASKRRSALWLPCPSPQVWSPTHHRMVAPRVCRVGGKAHAAAGAARARLGLRLILTKIPCSVALKWPCAEPRASSEWLVPRHGQRCVPASRLSHSCPDSALGSGSRARLCRAASSPPHPLPRAQVSARALHLSSPTLLWRSAGARAPVQPRVAAPSRAVWPSIICLRARRSHARRSTAGAKQPACRRLLGASLVQVPRRAMCSSGKRGAVQVPAFQPAH